MNTSELTKEGQRCPGCSTRSRIAECRCANACGWDECCAALADAAYERALARVREQDE